MSRTHPIPSSWLGRFKLAISRVRAGKAGDFALLKADLLGAKASPSIVQKLKHVEGYRPNIDLNCLAELPIGTFGRSYADWMERQRLKPFQVSDDLAEIANRNTLAIRYAITHDMFHVLTDFDTSYAGEIGVLSFAVAQNYSNQFKTGLKIASILYPILSLGKFKSVRTAKANGAKWAEALIFY